MPEWSSEIDVKLVCLQLDHCINGMDAVMAVLRGAVAGAYVTFVDLGPLDEKNVVNEVDR